MFLLNFIHKGSLPFLSIDLFLIVVICGKISKWLPSPVVKLLYSPFPYEKKGRKEMFYLTTHSTHFIYGYTASNIW